MVITQEKSLSTPEGEDTDFPDLYDDSTFTMLGAKGILPSDTELLRALHSCNSQNIQKWGISGCFCLLLLYTGNGNCILECRDNGTAVLFLNVFLYIIIL